MDIIINCPICNARSTLTYSTRNCRRCTEDLSLLYVVKVYSYKKRIEALKHLLSGDHQEAREFVYLALVLDKKP